MKTQLILYICNMNFLDFINKKKTNTILTESFNTKNLDKVHRLMRSIFKKKIDPRTVMLFPWHPETLGGRKMTSCYFGSYRDATFRVFSINYRIEDDSANAFSISFFDPKASNELLFNPKGKAKVTLEIETLGTSIAYFIPIICHIVKNDDYDISIERAKELGNELFYKGTKNESYIWNYGAVKYRVYENLTDEDVDDIFYLSEGYIQEATEAQNYRWQKKTERDEAFRKAKTTRKPEDKEEYERIQREYQEIVNAIRGGATTIEEVKMRISKGIDVTLDTTDSERRAQERLDKEGKETCQVKYADLAKWWNEIAKETNTKLYMGQAIYRYGKDANWVDPDEIPNQIRFNSTLDNVKGTIFFTYHDFTNETNATLVEGRKRLKELWTKDVKEI